MALRIPTTHGGASLTRTSVSNSSLSPHLPIRHLPASFPFTFSTRTTRPSLHVVEAKKFTSRTGRFDSKNRRSKTAMKEQEEDDDGDGEEEDGGTIERVGPESSVLASSTSSSSSNDGSLDIELPELPGDKPDFWEGPQWDALGFVVQYLWAFGIVFALIACGVAVATYNEGATDFKETPAYKESVQSRELLEGPDANSDVFESNPTEVAPSLE